LVPTEKICRRKNHSQNRMKADSSVSHEFPLPTQMNPPEKKDTGHAPKDSTGSTLLHERRKGHEIVRKMGHNTGCGTKITGGEQKNNTNGLYPKNRQYTLTHLLKGRRGGRGYKRSKEVKKKRKMS